MSVVDLGGAVSLAGRLLRNDPLYEVSSGRTNDLLGFVVGELFRRVDEFRFFFPAHEGGHLVPFLQGRLDELLRPKYNLWKIELLIFFGIGHHCL